ncbi:MAG: hypothetical protein ACFKPT_23860 [Gloeotrichia echinulata GP01]
MTVNYQMSRQYVLEYNLLFIKCQEIIEICGFILQESDNTSGYIKAKAGWSWKSFGEKIELQINHNGIINAQSACSVSTTLLDYGKNKENLEKLFKTLDTLLGTGNTDISAFSTNLKKQFQLIQNTQKEEHTEIISIEDIPLDNRFGSEILSVEHEFSKTVNNEVTLAATQEIKGMGSLELFKLIKAEISRTSSQKHELSTGESVTRRFKLIFSVKPGDFVTYKVLWKRRVISGEYHVMVNQSTLIVPYSLQLDLEYEVSTGQIN